METNPSDEDAKFNEALVRKLLEQQREQEQPSQSGDGKSEPPNDARSGEGEPPPSERPPEAPPNQAQSPSDEQQAPPQTEADENANKEGTEVEPKQPPTESETAQSTRQWLRQVPDDPGGLIRRKLLFEKYRRERNPEYSQRKSAKTW